jgi:hypothetical protein
VTVRNGYSNSCAGAWWCTRGHFYDVDEEPRLVVSLIVESQAFDEGLACIEALAGAG